MPTETSTIYTIPAQQQQTPGSYGNNAARNTTPDIPPSYDQITKDS